MLSIIIPTMWRYEPFFEILPTIVDLECVGEIIIINNDVQRTPNLAVLNHPKIVMHNSPENLYVCPAWNLGAKLATNEKMAFLSDDVHINLNVFQKVHDFMTPETGMIMKNILIIGFSKITRSISSLLATQFTKKDHHLLVLDVCSLLTNQIMSIFQKK